jgi:hypothetical protein
MKFTLREGVGFSNHGVVAILMFVGIVACGDFEQNQEPTSVTRQELTFNSVAVADATIWNLTGNAGLAQDCWARHDSLVTSSRFSCLLRWDLTSIPPGSTVNSTSLAIHVLDASPETFRVYRIYKNWAETEVTWTIARVALLPWEEAGAKGLSDRGPSWINTLALSTTGAHEIKGAIPKNIVQTWVNTPGDNHGISIASPGNVDTIRIASRQNLTESFRPILRVSYTPPGG